MRKTELLEIGCLEATKKMLKFSKKEEKKSRKQRLQKKMKMRKFEYEVSVKICKKGEILAVSFFRIKEMLAGQVQLKNMLTGEQSMVDADTLLNKVLGK